MSASTLRFVERRLLELNRGQHVVLGGVRVERSMDERNSFLVLCPGDRSPRLVRGIAATAKAVTA